MVETRFASVYRMHVTSQAEQAVDHSQEMSTFQHGSDSRMHFASLRSATVLKHNYTYHAVVV